MTDALPSPERPQLSPAELEAIRRAFERVSAHGWGLAVGVLCGLGLFVATMVLVIKGGPNAGAHLGLLSNYFPGFDIDVLGACIGACWAAAVGYAAGWVAGSSYNFFVSRSR